MAFNGHLYSVSPKMLSTYARCLDTESKHRYLSKLNIQLKSGRVLSITDPYLLRDEDWNNCVRDWPRVTYPDLFTYLKNSSNDEFSNENLKNYRSLSAYEYVQSGKVQTVKMHNPTACGEVSILSANVQPSQRASDKDHMPWAIVLKDGEIKTAHCTCMAGLGEACSHIAAMLFKVELAIRLDFTSEKAPTEEACKWNSTFSSKKVQNVPIASMDFSKQKWNPSNGSRKRRKVNCLKFQELPPFTAEEMRQLEIANPDAVIFRSKKRTEPDTPPEENLLPPTIFQILSRSNESDVISEMKQHFSTANCLFLSSSTTGQSVCKLWHQHRMGRFTASAFKEIVRRNMWNDDFLMKFVTPHSISTAAINWGREKEAEALKAYKEYMEDTHIDPVITMAGLVVNPNMPYLGATPDAFVSCSCCGKGVVEVKCPYKYRDNFILSAAKADKSFCLDECGSLKTSHGYFYQIQGQMAVACVQYCDFVVWTTKDLLVQRLEKDDTFWEETHGVLKEKYFQNLVPFIKRYRSENISSK